MSKIRLKSIFDKQIQNCPIHLVYTLQEIFCVKVPDLTCQTAGPYVRSPASNENPAP